MIGIVGHSSRIAHEFIRIAGPVRGLRLGDPHDGCDRFLFCCGLLVGQPVGALMRDRLAATFCVNFADVATYCDEILAANERARICVIGSESAFAGSYDMAYAGSKAALHLYVETKRLSPLQQLVAISPGILVDGAMTTRRSDTDYLAERMASHPKRRFGTCREVASLATWLLGPDGEFCTGTVVRLNGGERR